MVEEAWLRQISKCVNHVYTVSYRTFYTEWRDYRFADCESLKEAEEIAKKESEKHSLFPDLDVLLRVCLGDLVISMWFKGECIYRDISLNN